MIHSKQAGRLSMVMSLILAVLAAIVPATGHAAASRGRSGGYKPAQVQRLYSHGAKGGQYGGRLGQPKRAYARSHLVGTTPQKAAKPKAPPVTLSVSADTTTLSTVSATAPTKVETPTKRQPLRDLARGVFVDGPKHMWHSMVKRPGVFFGGLAAVGLVGAAGAKFNLHTEPAVIGAGVAALGAQLWQGIKTIAKAPRDQRTRLIGEQIVFPIFVWAGSSIAAFSMGHGGGETSVGTAAAKAMLFGGEAPANMSMAVSGGKDHHANH